MRREIVLPPIGADILEVTVTSISVDAGTVLMLNECYITVATEKVDIELYAPYPAVVVDICVEPGDVVVAGAVLLKVETEEADHLDQRDEASNVQIGLGYLASRDPQKVCSREELGDFTFTEFEAFVDRTAEMATLFREVDLTTITHGVVDDLRAVLFTLTRLVSEMDGFDPTKIKDKLKERHKNVKWRVGVQSEEAWRRFERLFELAADPRGEQGAGASDAYVFVSYAREDRRSIDGFMSRLQRRKIRFFRDERHIEYGERIVGRVHKELRQASHVVVLISAASLQSQWVAYEIGFARGHNIAVIPYIVDSGLRLPEFISGYRYLETGEEEFFLDWLGKFEV